MSCEHPNKKAKGMCAACYQRYRRSTFPSANLAHRLANKRWKARHPEGRLNLERRYRYKLSKQAYEDLLNRADGKCEICGLAPKKLCVDHNHKTGRVRGMLCDRCNKVLGTYDYLVSFTSLQDYLKRDL